MARKASAWRSRYQIVVDDRPAARWDSGMWKSGGTIELDGRLYRVRGNVWGSRFSMVDDFDTPVATANRVGRKQWTVEAGGRTYHFQRASIWNNTQELHADGGKVGYVKRTSFWRGDVAAELPGLPLPVQVFVVGVVIVMWDAQAAAAAG